jgi:hypothetical protein
MTKQVLRWTPLTLAVAHVCLWVWAVLVWVEVIADYGFPAGPDFAESYGMMMALDWIVGCHIKWISDFLSVWKEFSWVSPNEATRFLWFSGALLGIFGTAQWYVIGKGLQWLHKRGHIKTLIGSIVLILGWITFAVS